MSDPAVLPSLTLTVLAGLDDAADGGLGIGGTMGFRMTRHLAWWAGGTILPIPLPNLPDLWTLPGWSLSTGLLVSPLASPRLRLDLDASIGIADRGRGAFGDIYADDEKVPYLPWIRVEARAVALVRGRLSLGPQVRFDFNPVVRQVVTHLDGGVDDERTEVWLRAAEGMLGFRFEGLSRKGGSQGFSFMVGTVWPDFHPTVHIAWVGTYDPGRGGPRR